MPASAKQIHTHLTRHARRVAVVPHKNPDGDTLGAAVAFYRYLTDHGVAATLWCKTAASVALTFLPHTDTLRCDPEVWTHEQFDTVCIFDAGDPIFAGVHDRMQALAARPHVINFDHHISNTYFGNDNFIDTNAASTTEVVAHYFHEINHAIDTHTATALLTGLMTDTGNFTNPATSARALKLGADLVARGANYQAILRYTYKNKSPDALRLWGLALSRLKIKPELALAYTAMTRHDMELLRVHDNDIEGIANFLNSIGDTKISLVLKETNDGYVKGSFRTTYDDVDVAAIAAAFGGGGHKKAAGFAIRGRLVEKNGEWMIVQE